MPDDIKLHAFSNGLFDDLLTDSHRLNRMAGELLLVEAETAYMRLNAAEAARSRLAAQCDFERASEALATVNRFLGKLDLDADFRAEIESARNRLRTRVKTMWPRFRSA